MERKFWTRGFSVWFILVTVAGLIGGLYFLLIAGLTERSNPIGAVFSTIGVTSLLAPVMMLAFRRWFISRKG